MNTLFKTVTKSRKKESVVPFQQYQDIEHKILIEELIVNMSIGILPEEKKNKQRVIVDLEASIEPKADYEEDITNTVCYATIIADIEELITDRHFNLVETFAEEIANSCFAYPTVSKITISVKKPDIIDNVKAVGFSMTKIKEDNI